MNDGLRSSGKAGGDDSGVRRRLLSPDAAAAYLGLGSRWAIYRLIAAGQLPVMRLAGKLRIDREDLDALIETLKNQPADSRVAARRSTVGGVPARLAPLASPRERPASRTAELQNQ